MKKILYVLLLLLIAMQPIASAADKWVWIDSDENRACFFDQESIKKANGHDHPKSYFVWIKAQHTAASAKEFIEGLPPESARKYYGFSYELSLWQIATQTRKFRVVEEIYCRDNGELIERFPYDDAEWEDIIPNSWGEIIVEAVNEHLAKT
jgi:hypothetical protein